MSPAAPGRPVTPVRDTSSVQRDLPGQVIGSSCDLPGQVIGSSCDLPGQARGFSCDLPGQVRGFSCDLPGQARHMTCHTYMVYLCRDSPPTREGLRCAAEYTIYIHTVTWDGRVFTATLTWCELRSRKNSSTRVLPSVMNREDPTRFSIERQSHFATRIVRLRSGRLSSWNTSSAIPMHEPSVPRCSQSWCLH